MAADQTYRPEDRIMQGVIPYIAMPGTAGEAADFYVAAFGAEDIGRMPYPDKPGYMHVQVAINGGALMLTDHGQDAETPALRGHLQLVVPDGRAWFDRALAAGCALVAPFERQFWGDHWGMVRDPFGLQWAILTPDPALMDKGA